MLHIGVRSCAAAAVSMDAVYACCSCSERVTLWSARVPVAYVVSAIVFCRGGHDGRSLSVLQLQ
jgi:hypothetical protein